MQIAAIVQSMSDHHLRLAAQTGVSEIVAHYPGRNLDDFRAMRDRVESFGMKWTVIERLIPHDCLTHNLPGRDEQLDEFIEFVHHAAEVGVKILCYNWMPSDDWTRTSIDTPERGGARVSAFDVRKQPRDNPEYKGSQAADAVTSEEDLWANLKYFLENVAPEAERAGVRLALHPDDPPMSPLNGKPQIIISVEAMDRAMQLVPSPANTACYCQGTFASAGNDVVAGIHRLKEHISFVHFRDVVGTVPNFREAFHDTGDTDMPAAMQAYYDIGFDGPIRPDHAPSLDGETNEHPGYEMLGRLYAFGYMRGLMQSIESNSKN